LTFSTLTIIIIIKQNNMKRTCRNLSEEHKKKIGLGNKGKKRSDEVRNKISESLKKYWNGIPYENKNKENNNIMNETK